MDASPIMEIINNFAFPVAIVVVLMLFIAKILKSYKDSVDSQKEDVKELNKQYHEDYKMITDALNNNTSAINMMNKLIERIIDRGEN